MIIAHYPAIISVIQVFVSLIIKSATSIGKSEDLLGRRIKFKGKVPVCSDNFVVGVEIEVAADGDMRKAELSNQDSIKAFVLYQVYFAGFIK